MRINEDCAPKRCGAVTIELAVLVPVFILLIVIGVDFARVYYYELTLINAARTGAVFASGHPDNATNTEAIKAATLDDTKNLSPDPAVTSVASVDEKGIQYVTVTVKWDFYTIMGYPGVPHPITLERAVKTRVASANPKEQP